MKQTTTKMAITFLHIINLLNLTDVYLTLGQLIAGSEINHIHLIILLTLTYSILIFIVYFFDLINSYIFYFQQVIVNSIYIYIYCLRLLVENKKYNDITVTLTNLNLKNYFLISGLNLYLFIIIYYIIKIIKYTQNTAYSNIGNVTLLNKLHYFNDNLNTFLYLHNIILLNILIIIILHIILGLYMLFFDYIKKSSFILWTFSLLNINTFIYYYFFKINA